MVEYEFHEVIRREPLTFRELCTFGVQGWALFNVEPADTPDVGQWSHFFRRPSADGVARQPSLRALRGGVDRQGTRLGDLVGLFPESKPVRVRRDPAGRGA